MWTAGCTGIAMVSGDIILLVCLFVLLACLVFNPGGLPATSWVNRRCSSEHPELSSEYPELSSEYPEPSSEYPELSSEYPELSSEYPEPRSEYPETVHLGSACEQNMFTSQVQF